MFKESYIACVKNPHEVCPDAELCVESIFEVFEWLNSTNTQRRKTGFFFFTRHLCSCFRGDWVVKNGHSTLGCCSWPEKPKSEFVLENFISIKVKVFEVSASCSFCSPCINDTFWLFWPLKHTPVVKVFSKPFWGETVLIKLQNTPCFNFLSCRKLCFIRLLF